MEFIEKDYKDSGYDKTERAFMGNCSMHEIQEYLSAVACYMRKYGKYSAKNVLEMIPNDNRFAGLLRSVGVEEANSFLALGQSVYQMSKWRKSKQSYCFDASLMSELLHTEYKIKIPYAIFAKLPFTSFYLDFSKCPDLVNEIYIDGCLVTVDRIKVQSNSDTNYDHWLILLNMFKNKTSLAGVMHSIRDEDSFEDEYFDCDIAKAEVLGEIEKGEYKPENANIKLQTAAIMLSLLYLCSYEPDIRENTVSKTAFKKAKASQKKGSKEPLPIQEHLVGERFGAAFRKWTEGKIGQGSAPISGGAKKRPHMRRAHWHRYWIGKKGHQELIVKWVHECFCGCTEESAAENLDAVKHQVS